MAEQDDGFLSRWSRRKTQVRRGDQPAEPAAPVVHDRSGTPPPGPRPVAVPFPAPGAAAAVLPDTAAAAVAPVRPSLPDVPPDAPAEAPPEAPPAPTLDEARALTPEADFRRFVAPEVGADVRNTALKQLWSDPHFNVMDGLDIYIDDYGRPDPLPAGMLRKLAHATYLNLFDDEKPAPAADPALPVDTPAPADTAAAPELSSDPDEDPALRLQPHDEPGPAGADDGAGEGPGRERRGA